MDNILNKIGLYEFFGTLLPGLFFLLSLIIIDVPIVKHITYPNSEIFKIISLVLFSYIIGILLHEIASIFDTKFTKLRLTPRTTFLKENTTTVKNTVFKDIELENIQIHAREILNTSEDFTEFSDKHCSAMFFECKAFLENENKMTKADILDALFSMSFTFIICNIAILICAAILFVYEILHEYNYDTIKFIFILFYTILSCIIFYKKAKRYSEIRVRTIFRQYIAFKKTLNSQNN